MDDQLHIPVLGAGCVGDHTAVPPCVLLQCLVKVEAAVGSHRMPAARRELGRVRKHRLGPRDPVRASQEGALSSRTARQASREP